MDFATPKQEGSSIATTLEGALKQKYIKAVFATLIRNLPYNNILFSFFKEKIQQSALRYHLRKALEKSQDIESFKTNLQIRAEKANFNNATMQIIQNILKDTTQAIDEAREGAKTPTGVFTKAQEQETQQAQNKAFSASKQETQETQQAKQTQLTQEQTQLTTKTPQEIKDIISKWDLSKETNAQAKQRVIISKVSDSEKELLQKEFNFKGAKDLVREIDSHQIIHTLKQHSNEFVERQRGQEPITFDDIAQYETITQQYDLRIAQDNGRIIYVKQVNGSYVVVEEVLEGQDKIRFFDMWKQKGQINKEVLLSHSQRPNTIPSPSLESPMPSNTHNLTTKDKIKQARELGLNAKEAVHYIKTNNLPQTRANTLPQGREILEAEIVETQEIPYSQKKLIEWITNKHPKLIGSNQQARLTTKELLEFIKEENLPAKEALKLIKNTPRNLPIKIDSTSKQTTQNVDSKQIQNSHNLHTLRENAKTTLAPLINKEITNINTQEVATLTNKGIRKMTSDKAVAKSVANGFSEAEHFKAVEQVTKLFEKATKATSYTDPTDINLTIHRYNAPFENANALLTLKEYMQDGKRMYSLELENLDAIKFNPSGKDLMEQSPKSKDIDTANFNAPSENPNAILPKNSKINTQAQNNNNAQKPNKYQILRATSDYVSLKKEVMYAKQSLERCKANLQQAIKENNKETIQWAKGAIASIEKKIKSSQEDLNKEIQRIKKLGISLENPLNLKTTPMPNTKMQELQAIYKNAFTSVESIDKQINSAKTQKQKDKLHKQRQDIINKFDKQMQALLKDFSEQRQLLMRVNLTRGREETQELKSINFDFENPFSVYNLDKTIYREQWGNADGNYYQTQLVEARIFFDRFEPVIRQQIKSNINGVEDFSKGLIKDDDIFNLKTDIKNLRENIEILYNIKPLQEFGTNYAEHYHSGESAIQKLLTEAQAHKESGAKGEYKGQVAGAFYRKELGDIDLVWGEVTDLEKHKGYGLAHILDKRKAEFMKQGLSEAEAEAKAMEFAKNEISDIMQNGKITNKPNEATKIETQDYKLILKQNWSGEPLTNKWLVTAYIKNEKGESISSTPFTKGDNLPLNSSEIIPQNANALQKAQMQYEQASGLKGDSVEPAVQKVDSSEPKPQINKEIKDIIDSSPAKGRDMQIIGEANFTPQVVEYAHKNNKKVAIDKLSQAEAEQLGFKHPQDVRVTIDYQAINHTLNRHGADSNLVKESGQKAVDYNDIAEYRSIVKSADEKLFSKDDLGQDVILSFKQVNGYAVVVESIRKKGNELAFKSMYFENGSYKNSNAYKNAVDSQKANPSPAPYGYEPHADANTPPLKTDTAIIPQQKKDLAEFVKEYQQEYNALNSKLEAQVEALEKQIQNSSDDEWQKLTFQKIDLLEQQEQAHELFIEAINKLTPHYKNYDEILQITPLNDEHRIILNHRAEEIYQTLLKQAEKKVQAQAPTQQQVKQALEVIDTAFQKRIKEPFAIYEKEWYFDNTKITNLHDAQKFRHTINTDKHREYYTDELNKAYSILDKHEEAQTLKEKGVKSTQAGSKTHEDYLNVRDEIQAKAYQAKNTTHPSKQNVSTKELLQKLKFLHSKNAKNVDSSVESVPQKVESKTEYLSTDLKTMRAETKDILKPYTQQKITNTSDNTQAVLTHRGISEMLSAKAIAQSVKNGFTEAQHIQAVQHIADLFKNAIFKETQAPKHAKKDVIAYRIYNAPFDNSNAVISVQERKINDDVVYFVKLENLQPMQNEASAFTSNPQGLKSKVDNPAERQTLPSLDSKSIIPQTPQEIIKQAKQSGKSVTETKELLQKHKDNKIINTLKDMQGKDLNTKLGDKDLLDLYEKSSREIYDVLAKKLHLDSVKQYRSDGYALFENSSLGANAKARFETILRENIRQRQLENFQKPQNVKYEIQTEQGFKYYLDENNDVVINHKNELVDFKGGVIRTKPDKDGDILELNGILRLISPRNADNMFRVKRELTNNEFYDFHANLRLANYYQNGLFISDEKLYEVFKNMPRNADKQGLDDVMGILRGLTKSKNVNMAYAQEFINKHYGLEADYRTLARDIFKRVEKEYKKNGSPFGILFNDQKAIKDLRDMYGDEMARDFFKGENAVDFLLYTQAGHIENAFYKEGLGDIDLVWGEITDLEKHKGYGLAHILDKRKAEFMQQGLSEAEAEAKAMEFAKNEISNIMENGKIINKANEATRIETQDYKLILKQNWSGEPLTNKWLVTAYIKNEKGESISSTPFTKGDNLPLNSSTIIPQSTQENKKRTKPKEYIKIDYHQQHYTTKDLEKLEAMLQDRQEVLKNINEKISYYKAKTDGIKARNADDEKKYNDLYFSTEETDEAKREAIWQQMKAIKENNTAFLKQNQRIVDTYFAYQRKANKIESEIEFLKDKITKLEAQKVDSTPTTLNT